MLKAKITLGLLSASVLQPRPTEDTCYKYMKLLKVPHYAKWTIRVSV